MSDPLVFKEIRKEVIINFNTREDRIEIKKVREISSDERQRILCFQAKSSAGKKIYLNTNNLHYHLKTIPNIIRYIKSDIKNEKHKEFLNFLKSIQENFYVEEGKNYFLDTNKIDEEDCLEIIKARLEKFRNLESNEKSKEIFKNFGDKYKVYSLQINGKYIQESPFSDSYKSIMLHRFFGTFFDEKYNVQKNKRCHVCGKIKKKVTGNIDIDPYLKFYNTDKPNFFKIGKKISKKHYYKSFSVCEDCFGDLLIGINYIKENFKSRMNNENYLFIPKNIWTHNLEELEISFELFEDLFSKDLEGETRKEDLRRQDEILETSQYRDLEFDLLFFKKDRNSFVIRGYIPNIHLNRIRKIRKKFIEFNNKEIYEKMSTPRVSLDTLYYLIFPNKESHSNPNLRSNYKEMIEIVKKICSAEKLNYYRLIHRFNLIFKSIYHRKKKKFVGNLLENPLKMNTLLSIFINIDSLNIPEEDSMDTFTEVQDKNMKHYFEFHKNIYNNIEKQGLFILGCLINQVMKKQEKNNILGKINFEGIKPSRVPRLTNEILESLRHAKSKSGTNLLTLNLNNIALMKDRLENISNSNLNKDEVVFYILSGIAFSYYIAKNKKYSGGKQNDK